MRRLYVPLTRDELERLSALAQAERRCPQEQAAVLLALSLTVPNPKAASEVGRKEDQHEPERAA